MKHLIGKSRNRMSVYVDLIGSAAASHIAERPYLLVLVEEALRSVTLRDQDVSLEYDMQRPIGYDFVVDTTDRDAVFYAQTFRDKVYTRFVKNGKPTPAQHLALIFRQDKAGDYELVDTWVGHMYPPRPGSPEETNESRTYWAKHALVLDHQVIQSRTLTRDCPY